LNDANLVLNAGFNAGFRESGAMSLPKAGAEESSLMVGIRSMGLSFDCIIGYTDDHEKLHSLVEDSYLRNMFVIANDRFKTNKERITRFQSEVDRLLQRDSSVERPEERRIRKREEGLARQRELKESLIAQEETAQDGEAPDPRMFW
jgi:tRNA wybutosine-synthesizing protein 3